MPDVDPAELLRSAAGAFLRSFVLGLPPAGQRRMLDAVKEGQRFAVSIQLQPDPTVAVVIGEEVVAALRIEDGAPVILQ